VKGRLLKYCSALNVGTLLRLIFLANLIDAYLTLVWIDAGVATEANPIMNYLLQRGVGWFLAGKITAISIACLILWRMRNIESVFIAVRIIALVSALGYTCLIIFHLVGAFTSEMLYFPIDLLNF
jgi:hypothetical protein